MLTAHDVACLPREGLEALLARGEAVAAEDLAGFAFFGVSLGLPPWVERLSWKTFAKVFFVGEEGLVEGRNLRIEQRGVEGAFVPRRDRAGRPLLFGPFVVHPRAGHVVLDYGARASRLSPFALLRDPIVAVNVGSRDLLVGTTRLAFPWGERATRSFFTLERRGAWPRGSRVE